MVVDRVISIMRRERLARVLVITLVAAAVVLPAWGWWKQSYSGLIHARMAETGGWTPENLTAEVGKPLKLQLTSDDVLHGFAVGQMRMQPVDVVPGEISEVTLTFDQPGKYVFYCTRWCSLNHWRMRGTIEVRGPGETAQKPAEPPLYVRLGLDIDTEHRAEVIPEQRPSAKRGVALLAGMPQGALSAQYLTPEYYAAHSLEELWWALKSEKLLSALSDQDLWDLAAFVWSSSATPQMLAEGKKLYATNCAACHGESGAGDGVFADQLANPPGDHAAMKAGQMTRRPVDFTNSRQMLSASPAHLQGKILRGGMGTGMPYWGPIFTEEQTWSLVAYLWTFQLDYEEVKP